MRRTGWAAAGTRFATPTIAVKVRSTAHRSKLECANQLKNTKISVFELAPPMTSTPLFAGGEIRADDVKGIRMMDVAKIVSGAHQRVRKRSFRDSAGAEQCIEVDAPSRAPVHFESAQQACRGHAGAGYTEVGGGPVAV